MSILFCFAMSVNCCLVEKQFIGLLRFKAAIVSCCPYFRKVRARLPHGFDLSDVGCLSLPIFGNIGWVGFVNISVYRHLFRDRFLLRFVSTNLSGIPLDVVPKVIPPDSLAQK